MERRIPGTSCSDTFCLLLIIEVSSQIIFFPSFFKWVFFSIYSSWLLSFPRCVNGKSYFPFICLSTFIKMSLENVFNVNKIQIIIFYFMVGYFVSYLSLCLAKDQKEFPLYFTLDNELYCSWYWYHPADLISIFVAYLFLNPMVWMCPSEIYILKPNLQGDSIWRQSLWEGI